MRSNSATGSLSSASRRPARIVSRVGQPAPQPELPASPAAAEAEPQLAAQPSQPVPTQSLALALSEPDVWHETPAAQGFASTHDALRAALASRPISRRIDSPAPEPVGVEPEPATNPTAHAAASDATAELVDDMAPAGEPTPVFDAPPVDLAALDDAPAPDMALDPLPDAAADDAHTATSATVSTVECEAEETPPGSMDLSPAATDDPEPVSTPADHLAFVPMSNVAPPHGLGAAITAPAPHAANGAAPSQPVVAEIPETPADRSGIQKRKAPRKATPIPAGIVHDLAVNPLPCKLKDMSATGACLLFPQSARAVYPDPATLPDELTLVLRADRLEVDCVVVRRKGEEVGVRFTSVHRPMRKFSGVEPMPGSRRSR